VDRIAELRKHITKEGHGIEIGPYHSPIAPRRMGFRSIAVDVFDADELRSRAIADPNIPADNVALIENVELKGSAGNLAELVQEKYGDRRFDYIVSSHNLEHLPDPIRFLQSCEQVLKYGGVLSLAVPDRRYCFDFYRPVTELSEWLDAFHERRQRPTPGQVFRSDAHRSNLNGIGAWMPGTTTLPTPEEQLETAFSSWQALTQGGDVGPYRDAHCSAFTPASLELLLADLRYLGLIRLVTAEVTGPYGCEFFVHMQNPGPSTDRSDRDTFYRERNEIMQRAAREVVDGTVPLTGIALLRRRTTTRLRTYRWLQTKPVRTAVRTLRWFGRHMYRPSPQS
jgi:hypothetical protein